MRTIEIPEPGQVALVDRPDPQLPPDEILLRVNRVGYCGSDLAAFRGINPLVTYPRVPGHEIAATIEQIGPQATGDWSVGQQVLVIPYANCGQCVH